MVEKVLGKHIESIKAAMQSLPDRAEDLKEELEGTENVIKAPTQPMLTNFDDQKLTK